MNANKVPLALAAVGLAAWIAFALLAAYALSPSPLAEFDSRLTQNLLLDQQPGLASFFTAVTWLGDRAVLLPIVVIVTIALLARGRLLLVALWLVILLFACGGNELLKEWAHRPRPTVPRQLKSFSFPSGHAAGSLAVFGTLVYLVWLSTQRPLWRWTALGAAALLVALVGISRIYLGRHYFSDVAAGFAWSAAWIFTLVAPYEWYRRRQPVVEHDQPLLALQHRSGPLRYKNRL
jgi:undecaprenyl-diphosphatase